MVHVYSIGYMSHDTARARFFAYLSLFTFMMLVLVTADNFVQLFFGWEGVGLASYLLIGFWFKKPSANAAAIKALWLTVWAISALFWAWRRFTSRSGRWNLTMCLRQPMRWPRAVGIPRPYIAGAHHDLPVAVHGAMGKSAQFLLHTWLPDAMEGPTPVSALIHAATMVTAGIFLVARCSPLFELSSTALAVVTVVGAVTAFFAATVGLVQNDIKRVIAYSTCSQLGYMFVALGVGAYQAAMFHLFTHAFSRRCCFWARGLSFTPCRTNRTCEKWVACARWCRQAGL